MYSHSRLCYMLGKFCLRVVVPWSALSKELSSTVLTYYAEHVVSRVGLQSAIPC
jgi:hypothetical protein